MKHPEREDPTHPVESDDEAGQTEAATGAAPEASEPQASEQPAEGREAALEAEFADTKDRMLRALAEVENLRRRSARELDEARKYAIAGFARELPRSTTT